MQRLQNGRQISNALDTFVLRKALLVKIPGELSLQIPRVNRCLRVHRFQRRLHVNRHICELEVLEPRYTDDFVLKLLYELINKGTSLRVKLPEGVFDMTTEAHGVYGE